MVLTITLADGRSWSFERATLPNHWKSWLMQQLPYGTPKQGCTFKCEASEAAIDGSDEHHAANIGDR